MKRQVLYFTSPLVIIGVAATFFLFSRGGSTQADSVVLAESERPSLIAAPGRVEPISEEIRVASEISGKLRSVPVEEGDSVRKGQVIAVLENDDYRAQAASGEARARLEKSYVKSPIDGVVLRTHLKEGESVSEMRDMPIVTVANTARLRVRVDVDETDVSKLQIEQRAYVVADAYGEKKFWGRVVRIGRMLGKKQIRTDEPTERVDTKILETLIELDGDSNLPVGLRVDTFIEVGK